MTSPVEIYRKTRKVPDLPWNTYVCRPVAAVCVAMVEHTGITPNQLTLLSLLAGIVSAAAFVAAPGYAGLVAAALIFEFSYVLDCADGMLARWRGGGSAQGHLLDFLMDEIKAFLVLAAASVRLWMERDQDPTFLLVGIAGLVVLATGVAITTFQRRPEVARPTASSSGRRRSLLGSLRVGIETVARQIIHYPSYLFFVALSGDLRFFLYPYVVTNALYAARAIVQVGARFGRRVT